MKTDYERLAARYDQDRAKYAVPPDAVLAGLLHPGGVRVLDLGCGTGRWLVAQRDYFGDALRGVGVDPSPAMLAQARAKGDLAILCAPAESLPLRDASFDYVVCSYVFHHLDKERALGEVDRVLTADGVVRIENVEPAASQWWLSEFFPETVAIDAQRFWSPERIAGALERRGFAVEVQVETNTAHIAASDAIAEAERRVVSQLAVLDDDAYARGLDRLRRAGDVILTSVEARLQVTARRV